MKSRQLKNFITFIKKRKTLSLKKPTQKDILSIIEGVGFDQKRLVHTKLNRIYGFVLLAPMFNFQHIARLTSIFFRKLDLHNLKFRNVLDFNLRFFASPLQKPSFLRKCITWRIELTFSVEKENKFVLQNFLGGASFHPSGLVCSHKLWNTIPS